VAVTPTGTASSSPEAGEALAKLAHLRDADVENLDLFGQKFVELGQQLVAASRFGRRDQAADLVERQAEAARLLCEPETAFVFRVVEPVVGGASPSRAHEADGVVVANRASR
jgi:hypothetical protein